MFGVSFRASLRISLLTLTALVSDSLSEKRLDRCKVLFEFGGKAMALLGVVGRIIDNPHFAVSVFPGERLEWKVNCGTGSRDHQWRARLRVAKNQQLRGAHFQARFFGFAAVIDKREDRDAFGFQRRAEALNGLWHRRLTGLADESWNRI